MLKAIYNFPQTPGLFRNLSFMPSFFAGTGYVYLQVTYDQSFDYEREYRPARQGMLEVACGVARNKFNHLKKVVGIAMEPPRISQRVSEDFILLECENW